MLSEETKKEVLAGLAGSNAITEREGILFQRWLHEHVDPRILAVECMSDGAPMADVVLEAILDKAISPFVYWLREQPLPSAVVHPTGSAQPVPPAKLPGATTPGGSLSYWPDSSFLEHYGLNCDGQKLGWDRIWPSRFLGADYRLVNEKLQAQGFRSVQEVDQNGKSVRFWERPATE